MQNEGIAKGAGDAPAQGIPVSPNNPCPFLRAAVASGFLDGHIVPVSKLVSTVEAATGEKGLKAKIVGAKTWLVAVVANGLGPPRLLRNWWFGAELDALRNGPLDKRGSGSRILDATAQVSEAELVERMKTWMAPPPRYATGVMAKYAKLVSSASVGAVTS